MCLQKLNLPTYEYKLKQEGKKTKIFDAIRRKYFDLTPEEWVRQNLVNYLINEKKYPKGLMALEKGLLINELSKRTDVLVYSKSAQPILLVECKAPSVKINQAAFDQIARYNIHYKLPYLIVSNGLTHYFAKINFKTNNFIFLKDIPFYNELDV